jgi:hypothetical protein
MIENFWITFWYTFGIGMGIAAVMVVYGLIGAIATLISR